MYLPRMHVQQGHFIFPVQLTTRRFGNLTWLIHTLFEVMTTHTCIHNTYQVHIISSATTDTVCITQHTNNSGYGKRKVYID